MPPWALYEAGRYVDHLIEMGADVNTRDSFKNTPLMVAIASGNTIVAEQLLQDRQVDVNARNAYDDTALMLAVSGNQVDLIGKLLLKGADPNAANAKGETPVSFAAASTDPGIKALLPFLKGEKPTAELHALEEKKKWETELLWASKRGDDQLVKKALSHGASPNAKDNSGCPVISQCYASSCIKLLADAGADVNAQDAQGWTPLMYFASKRLDKSVKALLEAGADPTITGKDGKSAADYAEEEGADAICELIDAAIIKRSPDPVAAEASLQKKRATRALFQSIGSDDPLGMLKALKDGADMYAIGPRGTNALTYSISSGGPGTTAVLLASNTDVNRADSNGDIPLVKALKTREKRFSALVEFGADINVILPDGNTLLLAALQSTSFSPQHLPALFKKADVNAAGKDGVTPIMYCAKNGGYAEFIKPLAQAGANLDVQDANGNTPLLSALSDGKMHTAEQLVNAGADVTICNKKGESAVDLAKRFDKRFADLVAAAVVASKDKRIATLEGQVKQLSDELTQAKTPAQALPKGAPGVDLNTPKL